MIQIIAGEKGSGKTKKIIDLANNNADTAKGINVLLTTTDRYRAEIRPEVRFVDVTEEGINNFDRLVGFIKGMLCTNYDIECVFIDGANRMLGVSLDDPEMASFFVAIENIGANSNVKFVLTVSSNEADLPAFIKSYL